MNPLPCRRCRAEAVVEPTVNGWCVICTCKSDKHFSGATKSRDKAVQSWNRKQEGPNSGND
jgi:hypothetical protein